MGADELAVQEPQWLPPDAPCCEQKQAPKDGVWRDKHLQQFGAGVRSAQRGGSYLSDADYPTVLPRAKGTLRPFEISLEADTLGTFLIASNLRNGISKKGSATGATDKDSAGETVANVSLCPSAQWGPCQENLRASRLSNATLTPVHVGLWGFQALSPHSLGGFPPETCTFLPQSLQPFLPQLAFQCESGMSWGEISRLPRTVKVMTV